MKKIMILVIVVMFVLFGFLARAVSRKKIEIKRNDELAISTLQTLSVGAEAFALASDNKGQYPQRIEDLVEGEKVYLPQEYCGKMISGFKYDCDLSSKGYTFVATPVILGETGTSVFSITTGGIPEGFVLQEH